MLEKIYNEHKYWNILFFSTNIFINLILLFNSLIYKKYKKRWKKRIAWKWKFRKKRKKFKRIKTKTKNNKLFMYNFFHKNIKSLSNKLEILSCSTLTLRGITNSYLKLFYKDNKNYYRMLFLKKKKYIYSLAYSNAFFNFKEDAFKIYLRNYYRKPYWKLRRSRILHWNFFSTKTLRKRRYKGFIEHFLKKSSPKFVIITQLLSIFCRLKFSFIGFYKAASLLNKVWLFTNNIIFMLPKIIKRQKQWIIVKRKNLKFWKKAKKWSFLRQKRFNYPWLTHKRTFPKFLKKKLFKNEMFNFSRLFYDTFSRSFTLCRFYLNFYHSQYFMFEDKPLLLKLHMFRYRS